jgi:hypothetical protein
MTFNLLRPLCQKIFDAMSMLNFYLLREPVPGELATMPPLVSDKARDSETSSNSCLDQ